MTRDRCNIALHALAQAAEMGRANLLELNENLQKCSQTAIKATTSSIKFL